jgi:hypothetical protein
VLCFGRRLQPRGGDLGANRSPHREKERQRRQRIEVLDLPRLRKVAIECDISGGPEPAFD